MAVKSTPSQDAWLEIVNAKQASGYSFGKAWQLCKTLHADKYDAFLKEAEATKAKEPEIQNVPMEGINDRLHSVNAAAADSLPQLEAIQAAVNARRREFGEDQHNAYLAVKRKRPELFGILA